MMKMMMVDEEATAHTIPEDIQEVVRSSAIARTSARDDGT